MTPVSIEVNDNHFQLHRFSPIGGGNEDGTGGERDIGRVGGIEKKGKRGRERRMEEKVIKLERAETGNVSGKIALGDNDREVGMAAQGR